VRTTPSEAAWQTVRSYAAEFDAVHDENNNSSVNLFSFHVDVPQSHRVIDYIDVKHDHGEFDYQRLAAHWSWAGFIFNRDCRQIFVTGQSFPDPQRGHSISVVRLPTDARAPMFERVKAMAGYVHSKAFNRNTAFLDTDAFANRSFKAIFNDSFDIGVTFRTTSGYMPLNEGVIFCSGANPDAVRRFFSAYLATYESLIEDPVIQSYYGDIERWRGGQLSLNAIACPEGVLNKVGSFNAHGVRIALFPCNSFNYWVTRALPGGSRSWDRKFVLHLKGDSKRLVNDVIEYQLGRIRTRQRVNSR
jgi:hypothetical protein